MFRGLSAYIWAIMLLNAGFCLHQLSDWNKIRSCLNSLFTCICRAKTCPKCVTSQTFSLLCNSWDTGNGIPFTFQTEKKKLHLKITLWIYLFPSSYLITCSLPSFHNIKFFLERLLKTCIVELLPPLKLYDEMLLCNHINRKVSEEINP